MDDSPGAGSVSADRVCLGMEYRPASWLLMMLMMAILWLRPGCRYVGIS